MRSHSLTTCLVCVGASAFSQPAWGHAEEEFGSQEQRFIECQAKSVPGIGSWIEAEQPATKVGDFELQYLSRAEVLAMPEDTAKISEFSWQAVPSKLDMHQLIWSKAGLTLPEGAARIMSMTTGGHHTSVAESRLVYQTPNGSWKFAGIRIVNFGSEEHEWLTHQSGQLQEEDSDVLSALINDPCLSAQPDQSDLTEIWSNNNYEWTLEIEGGALDRPLKRKHSGFGRAALIYSLLNQWWN